MGQKNTIIVILGSAGHEYVATVGSGRAPVITPRLEQATPMSPDEAHDVIRSLNNCRAVSRDMDEYCIEVAGRQQEVARLRSQLPAEVSL